MTLVVSLRVPDGVVLAADSLQTTKGTYKPNLRNIKGKDSKTGEEINLDNLELPQITLPTSTSSYAQKLFPFNQKFGVAAFGTNIINKRTIYNHIKTLEVNLEKDIYSVKDAAERIKEYFDQQLIEDLSLSNKTKNDLPKDRIILGFQVVGYESKKDITGQTLEVLIKKESEIKPIGDIGSTVSGDTNVASKLWEIGDETDQKTNYGSFSLKDAIDYAEFLINTTSSFQRFANMIPTVGGAVDIALITNHSNFKWIKYKEITKILEEIEP